MFDLAVGRRVRDRVKLEGDLRRAAEGDFVVHYQPFMRISTGEVVGAEALVRWEHSERGLIPPEAFVHLAEETGYIASIGRRVLREACQWAVKWRAGLPAGSPFRISVNVSARQLYDAEFVAEVSDVLEATGLAPGDLTLEVTESVFVEEMGAAYDALNRLKEIGVGLAIDDFGTGYSSLSSLGRLPVDLIKLDQSLVVGIEHERAKFSIVSATINLAHVLGLEVVAEGVQTAGEAENLRTFGCDLGQGNYWYPTLSTDGLTDLFGINHVR